MKFNFSATKIYLFIEVAASTFFPMIFVASSLYQVTVAGLTPLQLVLVGTALEVSAFIFEIPTGVVADIYSRRLSIIIGYILMGLGFMVEGFFPAFVPILLAQVIWGLGYTFTSGASQAWISDEIGEDKANKLFLRATRFGQYAALLGTGLAVLVGGENVAMPIRLGGTGVFLIGVALMLTMPETGFKPTPKEDRDTWGQMAYTFREGIKAVRARPRLKTILWIGLFYGLYSEGFDRLWVKHLIDNFELPALFMSNQVAFFGVVRAIGTVLTIIAMRSIEKRLDTSQPQAIGRAMLFVTGLISVSLIGYAISPLLIVTLGIFLLIMVLRRVAIPLYTSWVNQKLDSETRATVLSISSQVDAVGQIAGGPGVGLIAKLVSVIAALSTSGLLLTPALFLVRRANAQSQEQVEHDWNHS
ncbi:MAG: MFS transporter [Anaerolineae bacterium]|jgi:DHA3 family tetracycline resistance protein-like MFS transporter|nr:MFS transporter [Anaerolineae bacterium]MBT4309230.1 MFS transporter [Anaerolineae bacterium]MBT4459318.1 MFS transporter [Anaerolineae bacterium]MBT4841186.1 MFS transporter [Anaerolineae bacterium]MBT6062560.1 MFS transporter [Anaerolineae bacterium]